MSFRNELSSLAEVSLYYQTDILSVSNTKLHLLFHCYTANTKGLKPTYCLSITQNFTCCATATLQIQNASQSHCCVGFKHGASIKVLNLYFHCALELHSGSCTATVYWTGLPLQQQQTADSRTQPYVSRFKLYSAVGIASRGLTAEPMNRRSIHDRGKIFYFEQNTHPVCTDGWSSASSPPPNVSAPCTVTVLQPLCRCHRLNKAIWPECVPVGAYS